jgi:hypothetical protein
MRLDKGDEVASLALFVKEDEEAGPSSRKDIDDKEKTRKAKTPSKGRPTPSRKPKKAKSKPKVKPKAKKVKKKTKGVSRNPPHQVQESSPKRKTR